MRSIDQKGTKYLTAAVVACLMVIAAPLNVHAQGLPIQTADPGNVAAKEMGDMFDSAEKMIYKQFDALVADNATHTKAQLDLSKDYIVHPELYKACAVSQGAAGRAGMRDGVAGLSGSMANVPHQTSGVTPAMQLATADKNGNLDPATNQQLCNLTSDKCANFDATRRDADINFASTHTDNMMSLPLGTTLKNGVITPPAMNTVSDPHQKNYIDAMNFCLGRRPQDPVNAGGLPNGATSAQADIAVLAVKAQRDAAGGVSPAITECIENVNHNTAISLSVGQSLGGNFLVQANDQQNVCASYTSQGIDDPAVTNCTTAGLSEAKAESIWAARFSYPGYRAYMANKLTPHELAMAEEAAQDSGAMQGMMRQLITTSKAVALNTMPRTAEAENTAMELKTSMLEQQKIFQETQHAFLDEQRKQFSEMTGLLRALVDSNQAIIANQKKIQEAKATMSGEPSYRAMPVNMKAQ